MSNPFDAADLECSGNDSAGISASAAVAPPISLAAGKNFLRQSGFAEKTCRIWSPEI